MAENKVVYNCGCGFSTKDIEEARVHADTKKHSLTALGMITPTPIIK